MTNNKKCVVCDKKSKFICSICGIQNYCSKECQKKDYKIHKDYHLLENFKYVDMGILKHVPYEHYYKKIDVYDQVKKVLEFDKEFIIFTRTVENWEEYDYIYNMFFPEYEYIGDNFIIVKVHKTPIADKGYSDSVLIGQVINGRIERNYLEDFMIRLVCGVDWDAKKASNLMTIIHKNNNHLKFAEVINFLQTYCIDNKHKSADEIFDSLKKVKNIKLIYSDK